MIVAKHEFKAGETVEIPENNRNLTQRANFYLANQFAQAVDLGGCECEDCEDCNEKSGVLFTLEDEENGTIEVKSIKDVNKNQLVKLLENAEVEFNQGDSKAILFDLYVNSLAKD